MPKIDKKIIKLTNKLNYPIILIFRVLTEFRRSCSRQQAFFLYYLPLFQQQKTTTNQTHLVFITMTGNLALQKVKCAEPLSSKTLLVLTDTRYTFINFFFFLYPEQAIIKILNRLYSSL